MVMKNYPPLFKADTDARHSQQRLSGPAVVGVRNYRRLSGTAGEWAAGQPGHPLVCPGHRNMLDLVPPRPTQ